MFVATPQRGIAAHRYHDHDKIIGEGRIMEAFLVQTMISATVRAAMRPFADTPDHLLHRESLDFISTGHP